MSTMGNATNNTLNIDDYNINLVLNNTNINNTDNDTE